MTNTEIIAVLDMTLRNIAPRAGFKPSLAQYQHLIEMSHMTLTALRQHIADAEKDQGFLDAGGDMVKSKQVPE